MEHQNHSNLSSLQHKTSLVSVITPTFNRSDLVAEAVKSVQSQTYNHIEHILVDDGSRPEELEKIKAISTQYKNTQLICRNTKNKGASVCRNIGFKAAKGDWIQFLDSDDLLSRDKVSNQIFAAVSSELPSDIIHGSAQSFLSNGEFIENRWPTPRHIQSDYTSKDWLLNYLTDSCRWAISTPLFRKTHLEKHMPMTENLKCCQEWELFIKILASSPKITLPHNEAITYIREDTTDGRMNLSWETYEHRKSQITATALAYQHVLNSNLFDNTFRSFFNQRFTFFLGCCSLQNMNDLVANAFWERRKSSSNYIDYTTNILRSSKYYLKSLLTKTNKN